MTDIAIRVQNLSKCYHIYDNPRDRLKQFVAPRLQKFFRQTPKQYFREFWAIKDISLKDMSSAVQFNSPVASKAASELLFWVRRLPDEIGLRIYTLTATVVAWTGYTWLRKTEKGFADVL
jgi:hypothetical protein